MINIHARQITDELTSLVKELDKLVGDPKDSENPNRAFVVLLTDDPSACEPQLKALALKHGIQKIPLTIFEGADGPGNYKIAPEAEVTVMMWKEQEVKVNHAFGKGGLDKDAVKKIVSEAKELVN